MRHRLFARCQVFPLNQAKPAVLPDRRRLTGGLPDVGTGRRAPQGPDSAWRAPFPAREVPGLLQGDRLQGAVIAYQSQALQLAGRRHIGTAGNIRGSTRMGRFETSGKISEPWQPGGRWLGRTARRRIPARPDDQRGQRRRASCARSMATGKSAAIPRRGEKRQCVLMQFVTAEDRENVGLTVIVLKTADKKARSCASSPRWACCCPPGSASRSTNRRGPCRLRPLPPQRLRRRGDPRGEAAHQARSGKTATFIIFQTPEEGIGIPISLNGFGPGFDNLP